MFFIRPEPFGFVIGSETFGFHTDPDLFPNLKNSQPFRGGGGGRVRVLIVYGCCELNP